MVNRRRPHSQLFLLVCVIAALHFLLPWLLPGHDEVPASALRDDGPSPSRRAFATLLYDDAFHIGVRVLGTSLRQTTMAHMSPPPDLICIVTRKVSDRVREILKKDGWKIHEVNALDNPFAPTESHQERLSGIFTKMSIWNMVDYDRVVYLDADVIALEDIKEMFDCGDFCAIYRSQDNFNGGVLVVTPNAGTFQRLTEEYLSFPASKSWTGGDQGFLNHFWSFARNCPWSPASNLTSDPTLRPNCGRLSVNYNFDVGLYVENRNEFSSPYLARNREDDAVKLAHEDLATTAVHGRLETAKIVHYTLQSVKPWQFFSFPWLSLNREWLRVWHDLAWVSEDYDNVRLSLELCLYPIAFVIFGIYFYFKHLKNASTVSWYLPTTPLLDAHWSDRNNRKQISIHQVTFDIAAILLSLIVVAVAALSAARVVPFVVHPFLAWVIAIEWAALFTAAGFGALYLLCFVLGARNLIVLPLAHHSFALATTKHPLWCTARVFAALFAVLVVGILMCAHYIEYLNASVLIRFGGFLVVVLGGTMPVALVRLANMWFVQGMISSNRM